MEFTTTQRGARALLYQGHKYVINRRGREDRIFWRCGKSRTCSGSVTTQEDIVISARDTHNHPVDTAELEAHKITAALKCKARETIQPIPTLYLNEVHQVASRPDMQEVAAKLPPFKSMRASLYRERRKRLPAMPQTRDQVHFEDEWAQTTNGKRFLLAEDGNEKRIVIFATDDNLKHLAEADTVFVDGTFHTCPELFYQIFTVHAFKNGQQFPLAYCLLPDKARDTYQRTFTLLKEKAEELHLDLSPCVLLSDFELAILRAAELSFPTTEIKGCYYHYCQCLNRKIQNLGLQVAYREDHSLNSFVRKTAALAFVPRRYVRLAWQALKANMPQLPRVEEFSRYFEETWLVGSFPLPLWNVFASGSLRTNNHVEGWHNRLKKIVGKAHPNVFEIVETFKKEQAYTEVSMAQLAAGAAPPHRSRKAIQKDRNIEELKRRFDTITLEEYLSGVSAHTNL